MDFNKQVRHRILSLMEEKGISQKDVARALGKSQATVCYMLKGRPGSPIRNEYIPTLANLFCVPADYFVTREENTDAVRIGAAPEREADETYEKIFYEYQCEINDLKEKVSKLEESREYYVRLANDLAIEKQALQRGENLDVTTVREVCAKQLTMSITLMKAVVNLLEAV